MSFSIENVETILLAMLVLDALALTILVLIQQGKGADVGAAFGSGSSNTMFGSAGGGSFLTRLTTWLAIGFFVIAFALAYTAKERAASAGTLGIPTVETTTPAPVSDEPAASDVPDLGADSVPGSDVPDLPEEGESVESDVPKL